MNAPATRKRAPRKTTAAELAALPPPEVYAREGDAEDDPAMALRKRLGGPVPFAVHVMAFFGIAVGVLAGLAYNTFVLGFTPAQIAAPIVGFALFFDTLFAAIYARRRLGRPLTPDQRARLSFNISALVLALTAGVALIMMALRAPAWSVELFHAVARRGQSHHQRRARLHRPPRRHRRHGHRLHRTAQTRELAP